MDDTTMNGSHGCDISDTRKEVKKKSIFWISVPHEGHQQYEFEITCVDFSDGIKRFIYNSDIVPRDYCPRMVYIFNLATGDYEHVGSYEYDKSGENGNNIYTFIEFIDFIDFI